MSVSWLPPIDTKDFLRFSYSLDSSNSVPFPDISAVSFCIEPRFLKKNYATRSLALKWPMKNLQSFAFPSVINT